MRIRRKIITFLLLLLLCIAAMYLLPLSHLSIRYYDRYIFYPFQSLRGMLFNLVPFSIGDIIYVLGGICLTVTLIRWVYYLIKFRTYKERLAASVLNTINTALFVYLFFVIGWGANYYKAPLNVYWSANYAKMPLAEYMKLSASRAKTAAADTATKRARMKQLLAYEQFLLDKLNTYAPAYHPLSVTEISSRARQYYGEYTDSRVMQHGLRVKPSFFGYFMERIAIEGYYNPFTGEGQVDNELPAFIMPFTISHEMAHQAGIAAEEDANLLAYALGTVTPDSIFRYAAYLNLWMYNDIRLFRRDSVTAKKFEAQLNPLTQAHLDTLEELSKKYHNEVEHYSAELYDSYLKMQDQKDGIRSYGNVANSAWLLEQRRKSGMDSVIRIP